MPENDYFKLKDELAQRLDEVIEKRIANERALQAQYIQIGLKIAAGALAFAIFVVGFVGFNTLSDIAKKTDSAVQAAITTRFDNDNPVKKYDHVLRDVAAEAHLWNIRRPIPRNRFPATDSIDKSFVFIVDYLKTSGISAPAKLSTISTLGSTTTDLPDSVGPVVLALLKTEIESRRTANDKDYNLIVAAIKVLARDPAGRFIDDITKTLTSFPDSADIRSAVLDAALLYLGGTQRWGRAAPQFKDITKIAEAMSRGGNDKQKLQVELLKMAYGEKYSIDDATLARVLAKIGESGVGLRSDDQISLFDFVRTVAAFQEISEEATSAEYELKLYSGMATALSGQGHYITLQRSGLFHDDDDSTSEMSIGVRRGGGALIFARDRYERFLHRVVSICAIGIMKSKGVISDDIRKTLNFWLPRGMAKDFDIASTNASGDIPAVRAYWIKMRLGDETAILTTGDVVQTIPKDVKFVAMYPANRGNGVPMLNAAWRRDGSFIKIVDIATIKGVRMRDLQVESVFNKIAVVTEWLQ